MLNVDRVMRTDYVIDDLQPTYFVIESFDDLYRQTVERDFDRLYRGLRRVHLCQQRGDRCRQRAAPRHAGISVARRARERRGAGLDIDRERNEKAGPGSLRSRPFLRYEPELTAWRRRSRCRCRQPCPVSPCFPWRRPCLSAGVGDGVGLGVASSVPASSAASACSFDGFGVLLAGVFHRRFPSGRRRRRRRSPARGQHRKC